MLLLRREVVQVVAKRCEKIESLHEQAGKLKKDILNVPKHVFGDHTNCVDCNTKNVVSETENYLPEMKSVGLFQKIMTVFEYLSRYADSLILNLNNNPAEAFNSLLPVNK